MSKVLPKVELGNTQPDTNCEPGETYLWLQNKHTDEVSIRGPIEGYHMRYEELCDTGDGERFGEISSDFDIYIYEYIRDGWSVSVWTDLSVFVK